MQNPVISAKASESERSGETHFSHLQRAALFLSIFAFIPPLGIAAIVLGHISIRRAERDNENSEVPASARAALWIAYLQLAILSIALAAGWHAIETTVQDFRRDALVQSVLRAADRNQPLDKIAAAEAEQTAQTILTQLVAMQDQYRRNDDSGLYACQLNPLIENGLQGATEAEKQAFAHRVADSPYIFEISGCNPLDGNVKNESAKQAAYNLTAVPRPPRMSEGSSLFCSDQTGVIRRTRGGLSLDCLNHGETIR